MYECDRKWNINDWKLFTPIIAYTIFFPIGGLRKVRGTKARKKKGKWNQRAVPQRAQPMHIYIQMTQSSRYCSRLIALARMRRGARARKKRTRRIFEVEWYRDWNSMCVCVCVGRGEYEISKWMEYICGGLRKMTATATDVQTMLSVVISHENKKKMKRMCQFMAVAFWKTCTDVIRLNRFSNNERFRV